MYAQYRKIGKSNNLVFGSNKTKGLKQGWPKSTNVTNAWGKGTLVLIKITYKGTVNFNRKYI